MQTVTVTRPSKKRKSKKGGRGKATKGKAMSKNTKKSSRKRRKATTSGTKVARSVRTTSGRKTRRKKSTTSGRKTSRRRRTASGPNMMNFPANNSRKGGFLQLGNYWNQVGMRSVGQAGGMFGANVAGGFLATALNWILSKVKLVEVDENNQAIDGGTISPAWAKVLTSLAGSYLTWRFVPQTRYGIVNDMKDGAVTFFGFSTIMNALKATGMVPPSIGQWLGFAPSDADDGKPRTLMAVGSTVGQAVLTEEEVRSRVEDVKAKKGELEAAIGAVVGPLNPNQEAVYAAAAEHIASVDGPLDVVEFYLGQGNVAGAEQYLTQARGFSQVAEALLAGLTSGIGAAEPAPAPAAEPAPIETPDVVPIADAATGEVLDVPAPVAEQVATPTASGNALNLDLIYPWSQWVAQQKPGWSPSEVASAFVLKYLANNGHTWGYGPNAVTAARYGVSGPAYGNMNTGGQYPQQQQPSGVGLVVGGSLIPCGASPAEVSATVSGIFERYYGSY